MLVLTTNKENRTAHFNRYNIIKEFGKKNLSVVRGCQNERLPRRYRIFLEYWVLSNSKNILGISLTTRRYRSSILM